MVFYLEIHFDVFLPLLGSKRLALNDLVYLTIKNA